MSSLFPMMQPESYCTQCKAPMYRIFERLLHTCSCSGAAMDPYKCGSDAASVAEANAEIKPADTTPQLPVMVSHSSNFEEITSERARRVKEGILEVLYLHQIECKECKRLSDVELTCYGQLELQLALRFWERHIGSEAKA